MPVVDLCAIQTSQFLLVPARFSLDDFRIISIRQHNLLLLWASHWQGLRGNATVVVTLVNVTHGWVIYGYRIDWWRIKPTVVFAIPLIIIWRLHIALAPIGGWLNCIEIIVSNYSLIFWQRTPINIVAVFIITWHRYLLHYVSHLTPSGICLELSILHYLGYDKLRSLHNLPFMMCFKKIKTSVNLSLL